MQKKTAASNLTEKSPRLDAMWTATSHRPVRVHQRPIGIFYLIDQEQISQSAERSEVKEKRMSVQFQNRHASCSSKVKIKLCQIARYRAFCGPRLHVSTYRRDTKTFAQSMNFYGTTLFLFLSGGGGIVFTKTHDVTKNKLI